jgi:hypothetical protein
VIAVGSPGKGGSVIAVGIPGKGGSVIAVGRCGNAPGDRELLVGVPVSVPEAGVVDVVGVPVVGVVVAVAVVVGVVVVVVVLVVAGAGVGLPWASWMMPQMISPSRIAMRTPQPTNAIGVRQPGMGSSGSGA